MNSELENTCAGKPIKSAMHSFSQCFLSSCKKFSELAKLPENEQNISIFNSSCIINAACFLEAKINEEISMAVICFEYDQDEPEGKAWRAIQRLQKKLNIQEKWDLVALRTNGIPWDNSVEPFQSFEIISSLRNELVHYKAAFHGKDEAPNRKISGLMKKLDVSSQASWTDDDCSSWVSDLLGSYRLAEWVYQNISSFDESYYSLRHTKT
ncbi:MAG: hypothetical protein JKY55_05960 [Aliivibrio sp.]|uniref:hypothetical protein n=1 Tax=Aliivibrio sp. TaxID=1872443 RepID=UPI001A534305|nr:hypothetical protein [Aliivibrio sp.]